MQLRHIFRQDILIFSLVTFSSLALSSQSLAQEVDPTNPGNEVGPGRDTSKDPLLSPDEVRIQEYLDPPIMGVSDEYGPPEAPKKPRRGGMKDIPAPKLKHTDKDPNTLPVHDVRRDVGPSTEWKLERLEFLYRRLIQPDFNEGAMKPSNVRQEYIKLYSELDKDRRNDVSVGIRMPAGPAKNATLARARAIGDVLKQLKPLEEVKKWAAYHKRNPVPEQKLIKRVLNQRNSLTGSWTGINYICEGRAIAEKVDFAHEGDAIVAIKRTGDACVPTGRITFSGEIGKGVDCHLGRPERPDSEIKRGTISVISVNLVEACGVRFKRNFN